MHNYYVVYTWGYKSVQTKSVFKECFAIILSQQMYHRKVS